METKLRLYIVVVLSLPILQHLYAQDVPRDSIPPGSFKIGITGDSINPPAAKTFTLSKDSLDAPVHYQARDSMRYDIANKRIHLYGAAEVKYTTITLKADYIIFDWDSNTVTAEGSLDSLGRLQGKPEFSDRDENFKAKTLRYNFKTRKGIIYEAVSHQNDVYVLGERAKFTGSAPDLNPKRTDDVIYSKNAIFTSCDLPEPHYGIRSTKQKVIPNKTVVVGPSRLEIAGVPTPLILPFGFFPITPSAKAGLIIPNDYGYEQAYGVGFRGLGYFTPLGQYFDMQVSGDLFFKGLWGVHLNSRYKKRYKYNGNLNLSVGSIPSEGSDGLVTRQQSFRFGWLHNQDANAHPTIRFGGNANIQTNSYQRNFQRDFNSVSQATLNSSLNFSYNPTGKPWNLSAGLDHNQNNFTREMTISFPNLNFQMRRIAPFARKERVGPQRWYEKFGFSYNAAARNRLQTSDTTLFKGNVLDKLQYGVQQNLNADINFNLLKFFRISPNVRYAETWYFQTLQRTFDPATIIEAIDTLTNPIDPDDFTIVYDTTYGRQTVDTLQGFKAYRNFSAGLNLNFDVFGTILFKRGWLRGLRHFMKPNVGFAYSPDFKDPRFGYVDYVDSDNRPDRNMPQEYSVFLSNGVFGSPSISGKQMALTYSVSNLFQGKYLSKKDSTIKYFNFFDDVNFNGSYNFAADSFQWSRVNFSARGRWFRDFLNINFNAQFDPYDLDENGRRTKELSWKKNRRPLEFIRASLPFNNTLRVSKIRNWLQGKPDEEASVKATGQTGNIPVAVQDFWSLFDNFSVSHNISFDLERTIAGRDTFRIGVNSIRLQGSVQITKNWRISIDNFSYDFNSKRLVYPSFSFYRDLHCWEMSFGWYPEAAAYTFSLRVKPGTLGFIEVPYQRRSLGNFGGF